MSSAQYSLCSTAGLETVADTPDGAAAALVRHLSDVCRLGGVDWLIIGPQNAIYHGRFDPKSDLPVSAAVADHVDATHGKLLRDAARLMSVGPSRR
jgi:hypothetical protein